MKKIKNIFSTLLFLMIYFPVIWVLPLSLYIAYAIAESNLPDWFKFFLLK